MKILNFQNVFNTPLHYNMIGWWFCILINGWFLNTTVQLEFLWSNNPSGLQVARSKSKNSYKVLVLVIVLVPVCSMEL